jgi:hypothetical protein
MLTDTGNAALWLATAAIVAWIIQYTWLTGGRSWRNTIGVTLIGEAFVILAIYVLALMSLADPADYARFAATIWYRWVATVIIFSSAAFIITRIAAWERIRRLRDAGEAVLPAHMAARIKELERQLAECQQRAGDTP